MSAAQCIAGLYNIDIGNKPKGTLSDDFFNRIYVVKEIRHKLNLTGCVFYGNLPLIYPGKA